MKAIATKGPFSRTPLHVRVRLSIIAISLLLLALDGWWAWKAEQAALGADLAARTNLVRSLAQHAHNTIEVADNILFDLRERIEADGLAAEQVARLNDSLRSRMTNLPLIHALFIYDRDGQPIAESLKPVGNGFDQSDRGYFQYHRDHTDLGAHIGRPNVSRASGDWLITVSRRFNLPDGRFGGVLLATISIDMLERFYKSFDVGKNGVISLDDATGIAMVRSSGSGQYVGSDLSKLDVFRLLLKSPVGDFSFVSPLDGVARLVSYRLVDDYPLVVVVARARGDALADWRMDVWLHFGISIGAVIALLFFGSRFSLQIRRWETAERHYRLLADNVGDIVILMAGGRFIYVSPASQRILGYKPEEMVKLSIKDLIHPEDFAGAQEAPARLSPTNPVITHVHRNIRNDGTCIWVEVVYRQIHSGGARQPTMALTVRDVSARIAAEREAVHAAERATLALEATNDFVFAVDKNWHVTYVSARTQAVWNSLEAAEGRGLWEAAPTLLGTAFESCYRRAMAERIVLETTAQVGDGRWFTAHVAPLADDDCSLFVFFRDVTDSKRGEASLIEARTAAETIARAKSEFMANMSHELRTPLNAVIGFAELIEKSSVNHVLLKRHREYATDIRESGEHLLGLINEILDYSKMEAGCLTLLEDSVSPADLIESCVRMMRPRADRTNIALRTVLEDAPSHAIMDEKRIRQIVLNLLSNAVKFTPAGGSIDVECREADGLVISVRDTGIGIPHAEIDHVMEAYVQVADRKTRSQEGTGLGLPLSRRLAEMHGGSLRIESTLGFGTTVTLHIPVHSAEAVQPEDAPAADGRDAYVVLVVEDDGLVRTGSVLELRSRGFEVLEAANGNEALAILQQDLRIDFLVTDVVMPPGLDGLALARKARQMRPGIGVLLASGFAAHLIAAAGDTQEFPILAKPYRPQQLALHVREMLPGTDIRETYAAA